MIALSVSLKIKLLEKKKRCQFSWTYSIERENLFVTMKLTGGVVADWQAVSTEQQQRGEREGESSEVGYVKRTIYILVKICNPKVKLRRFILFYLFFKYPIKLKRFVSLSHILRNKNHRFI